jgi:Flagellar motor component
MGKAFGGDPDKPDELIVQLAELATIARKDGMIALEGQEIKNKFIGQRNRHVGGRYRWQLILIHMSEKMIK